MKSRFKSLGKAVLSLTKTNSTKKESVVKEDKAHQEFIQQVASENEVAKSEKKKSPAKETASEKKQNIKATRKSAASLKSEGISQSRASMESAASSLPPTPEISKLPVLDAAAPGLTADKVVSELLHTLKEAKSQIENLGANGRIFADCVAVLDELNAFISQHRSTFAVLGKMADSVNGNEWRLSWMSTVEEIARMQTAISNADYELRRMVATKSKHSTQADRANGDLLRADESFRTAVQNLLPSLKRSHLFPSSASPSPSPTPDRLPSRYLSSEDDHVRVDASTSAATVRTPLKDIQAAARSPAAASHSSPATRSPARMKSASTQESKRSLSTKQESRRSLSPSLADSRRSPPPSTIPPSSQHEQRVTSASHHLYLPTDTNQSSPAVMSAPSPARQSLDSKGDKLCVWGEACLARADGGVQPEDNYPAALQSFRQGALLDHPQCQFRLGQMLRHGLGAPSDFVEARKWLALAAQHGSAEAQWELAQMTELTQGAAMAEPAYRELAAIGQAAACVRVAQGMIKGEMVGAAEEVEALLEVAAAQGHAEGLNMLGMHLLQHGAADGPARALECFQKAALLGNGAAMNNLGVCFEEGAVVEADGNASKGWYIQGATVGNANAMNNLGFMLLCEGDPIAAGLVLEAAVQAGSVDAHYNLGRMLELGRGVPRDTERCVRLYEAAAKRGSSKALNRLGCLLYSGTETLQADAAQALICFKEAAAMGSAEASNSLGLMFEQGEEVPRDLHRARELYSEAAQRGCADGAYNLGCLYEQGRGVKLNLAHALAQYQLAAARGHAYAAVDALRVQLQLEAASGGGASRSSRGSPGKGSPPREREAAEAEIQAAGAKTHQHVADVGGVFVYVPHGNGAETKGDTTLGTAAAVDDRSMAIEDIEVLGEGMPLIGVTTR